MSLQTQITENKLAIAEFISNAKTIFQLSDITDLSDSDYTIIYDVTTGESLKITVENFKSAIADDVFVQKTKIGDSFYIDDTEDILRSNVSTYKQTVYFTSGTQVFTLDFEPTSFIGVFVNGIRVDESNYIYSTPNSLEILGTMEDGDILKVVMERFIVTP